ncbi:hypothetical protein BKH41_00655 [Helicobacter sp. 12S02232-10]|uniref:HdeD family acid-resistance protein n=1 Tax=Helicobacter sp. 12S02232-10 TaxID=1476197 RepID=UPI000BA65E41|nr:DUF308 domain-containing protein [Helicobacter sp. 12S02232-10]PAF49845.1 hypothetical protein BKH41_00655 [Helicobacter sp. 12S02232-10]
MDRILSVIWFLFGLAILACGIISVFTPTETFLALMVLIPIILIASGIVGIFYYFRIREFSSSQWVLGDGLLSLFFGLIFTFGGVEFTSITMIYFVAFLAIFKGILGISSSFVLKKSGFSQWFWLFIVSTINIFIGIIFAINPSIASVTIGILAGIYFIFFGLISLMGWWGLKKFKSIL